MRDDLAAMQARLDKLARERPTRTYGEDDDPLDSTSRRIITEWDQRTVNPAPHYVAEEQRIADLERALALLAGRVTEIERNVEVIPEGVGNVLREIIEPLQKRIEKLEMRSEVRWAGTWSPGMQVAEGEIITDRGSLWICTATSSDRPGDNADAFRLIVKNGHGSDNGSRRSPTATRN